ncbi:ComEA family DNA-binding protein [Herbiconiux sp. CPCC 203407]|uniref:ComEA family DNA-binding protein n=1 Tax=Herbiconiux oxytropis TaxID=2970915 RepID=A0AA41XEN2_9MICO|nr:ComEA family DNA-binding protein [Herbiconiux oxytropis]MCS5720853.1 ComEA family DNA-binding protein [Herbiconiux oxytropis]MCS5724330.1 ComEA family DNA-binding protein [Herbiconiux oxytropis]
MSDSGARPGAATGDGVLLLSDRVAVEPQQAATAGPQRGGAIDDVVERGPTVRVRVAIGAALVLVVVALVASVLVTALSPVGATTVFGAAGDGGSGGDSVVSPSHTVAPSPSPGPPESGGDASMGESRAAILVHVLGSVVRPGVYELAEGSRAVDAVALAGGFAEGAEQSSLNLARPLVDGEQLRVLAVGEAPAAAAGSAGAGGSPSSGASGGPGVSSGVAGGSPGALINLNSATALDLDTLPRIGPAMAARIISWRDENGPFATVDDLLQVTGIGDKTFESLRPLVTV